MNYGKILTRAWQLIWKYKILWLFGILASCGNNANSASGSGANGSGFNYRLDYTDLNNMPPEMFRFFHNMSLFFERNANMWPAWVGVMILVVFILVFITFFIRVYGQVGLVRGALKADQGQPQTLRLAEIHEEVKPFYWRLFGFQLLIFAAALILVGLLVGIIFAGTTLTLGLGLICFVPLICLMVPLGWAVTVVIKQALIAMLVDDLNIGDSLQRGWSVVRDRAVDYLVMGLILLVGGWIISIIFALPQLFALAPLISGIIQGATSAEWNNIFSGLWFTIICLIGYWPVLVVLRGILNSFTESAWVLTYLEATRGNDLMDEPELLAPATETE